MRVVFLQNSAINESLVLTEISAFLKSKGHICNLFIDKNEKDLFRVINNFSPEIFIIPWDIGTISWILEISRDIRRDFNIPVVFCGAYPSFYPDIAINYPEVEIMCIGEAEYALLELLDKLEKKEDISNIRNIWVKRHGKIYKNELRPLIDDLDKLPFPDRDIYFKYDYLRDFSLKRFISGRGCPNSCSFCYNPLFRERYKGKGKFVRKKSVARIIQEIEDVRGKAVVKSVHFSDDIFTYDKNWIIEFSTEYKKRIKLPFTCNASAETLDEELIKALKEAGCRGIAMGIETGNENIRISILNKKVKDQEIIRTAKLIKEHGLLLLTFNMIALPTETIKDVFETMEINARIKADYIELKFFIPLLGTKLADFGLEKGFFDKKLAERLLNNELYPSRSILKLNHIYQFENLFYLFVLGVKFPSLIPFIKRIIKLPLTIISPVLGLINSIIFHYYRKQFFKIPLYQGINHFFNAGSLKDRTNVFNIYLP